MEALCRITLLRPYRDDPAFIVPIGNGQISMVPFGAGAISVSDPSFHVGFNSAQTGQEDANRFKAAQDVVYQLGLGDEQSIIVPVSCAMVHFGDWTITPGSKDQRKVKRTYGQERIRVAGQWGDFKRMPRGKKMQDGKVQADTRCIGLPDIPHVKIEILEQNGRPYGTPIVPWDFYKWEQDIDAQAVREAQLIAAEMGFMAPQQLAPAASAQIDLSALSDAQLEQLAGLMADKLKGRRGGPQAQS
jgi:hypothetical protein